MTAGAEASRNVPSKVGLWAKTFRVRRANKERKRKKGCILKLVLKDSEGEEVEGGVVSERGFG